MPQHMKEIKVESRPGGGGGVIIYVSQKWSPYVEIMEENTIITRNYETVTLRVYINPIIVLCI